jgi:hypothetical protein
MELKMINATDYMTKVANKIQAGASSLAKAMSGSTKKMDKKTAAEFARKMYAKGARADDFTAKEMADRFKRARAERGI